MVREFHENHLPSPPPKSLHQLSAQERLDEIASIGSEYFELVEAMRQGDIVESIDALCDVIYVAIGIGLRHGIDITAAFDEVHASNREKLKAAPGTMGRGDGKGGGIKPPGWVKPRIKEIIVAQAERELVKEMQNNVTS